MLENLAIGAATAFTPINLGFAFLGSFLGTLIGVLPGIGPLSTIAILLPITFALEPSTALIMLAAIYYGAQYGGSTTAILLNLPGETSSVITTLDGHALAKNGRAGPALAIAALSSFLAGTIATVVVAGFAPLLTSVALTFSSAEYFSLMVLGLAMAIALSSGDILKSLAMIIIGLILGLVGTDVNSGLHRFTFGSIELWDGIDIVALAVGLFAIRELATGLESPDTRPLITEKVQNLMPTWADIKVSILPALRGTAIGSMLGVLPGGGSLIATFSAYAVERQISKTPELFGTGLLAGVAAPEAANNASAQTSFIPMLTLGIPSNPLIALLLGALIIHGVQPGPRFMTSHPDIFWGVVVSMWIGNLILVILNLPLIGIWVRILRIPFHALFPGIVLLCCIGIYGSGFSTMDVFMAAGFGLFGYFVRILGCDPVPMVLGFVLGPMMEENFRRTLTIWRGDATIFLTRPLSLALLAMAALVLALAMLPRLKQNREVYLQDED